LTDVRRELTARFDSQVVVPLALKQASLAGRAMPRARLARLVQLLTNAAWKPLAKET
jgi:hypothetical protein